MIQLDNRKKIIIWVTIFLVIIVASIFIFIKNNKNTKIVDENTKTEINETTKPRIMTQEEKSNVVGINPDQEAEVLNDQDGLYIYRIKK